MTNLVLIKEEREKKSEEGRQDLIKGLRKLLERAEAGDLKGVCFAGVDFDGDMTIGVLRAGGCGIHELVGLSSILNDSLLQALRE